MVDQMTPRTVHNALQMLKSYHQRRRDTYQRLAESTTDERTQILLNELVALEETAIQIVGDEDANLGDRETYLMPGPTLNIDPAHAMDCRCDSQPTFEDALWCALSSDAALDELIDLVTGCTAALSIQELASRLRELERTKDRQVAKFTRED